MGSMNENPDHYINGIHNTLSPKGHNDVVLEEWQTFIRLITGKSRVIVDGSSLSIASIVAVSRYVTLVKSKAD
jgi:hypothetical protein